MKKRKFDEYYRGFTSSTKPLVHKRAIEELLATVGLKNEFKKATRLGIEPVKRLFCDFEKAAKEDWVEEKEKESLRKIGMTSKQCFDKKDFARFADFVFGIVFRNVIGSLDINKRDDFKNLTIDDLYKKRLLPSEIFLQFFLLETLSKNSVFNWNRERKIIEQSLICLSVCFADIYTFLCDG